MQTVLAVATVWLIVGLPALFVGLIRYRWAMRRRNLDGLKLDRRWYRELDRDVGIPAPIDTLRRDNARLDLAAEYIKRNWWWTSRARVFTEDLDRICLSDSKREEIGRPSTR